MVGSEAAYGPSMDATAGPAGSGGLTAGGEFGTGRLILADSRLAFHVVNQLRHLALRRMFGVSREQANLLTFVLAAGAADAAYLAARHAVRAPLGLSGTDAALGGLVLRESALGLAGPASRGAPWFGTLLAFAVLRGVVRPGMRRAVGSARATEQRLRQQRISRYTGG